MAKEQKQILRHLWEDVNRNQLDIEKIKFRYIETATYTVTKKPQLLKILENYTMNADHTEWVSALEISVPFDQMPSWGLSGVHPIPLFYTEGDNLIDPIVYGEMICIGNICWITVESGTNWFVYNVNQKWKYINGQYVYITNIIAYLQPVNEDGSIQSGVYLPLYLDFDILIENNYKYTIQQGYKK